MWTQLGYIATFVSMLTLTAPSIGAVQSSQSKSDTFTWLAEFVSVDTSTMSMTMRALVAYQEALSELKQFKPGEQVWIVWSGVQDYSEAVRQVRRSTAGRTIDEDLVLPAELISPDA